MGLNVTCFEVEALVVGVGTGAGMGTGASSGTGASAGTGADAGTGVSAKQNCKPVTVPTVHDIKEQLTFNQKAQLKHATS